MNVVTYFNRNKYIDITFYRNNITDSRCPGNINE